MLPIYPSVHSFFFVGTLHQGITGRHHHVRSTCIRYHNRVDCVWNNKEGMDGTDCLELFGFFDISTVQLAGHIWGITGKGLIC